MSVPPFGRSFTFVCSAAGFIATSTFGASPGVRMSWSAKWTWKPDTPGSEPAGARISAGKSGYVARSFPSMAVSLVNRSPVSCMPSPESPAKRMITASRCSTFLVLTSVSLAGGRERRASHEADAPRGAGGEQRVRVDLVGPAQEVPRRIVRRRALHRETRGGRCDLVAGRELLPPALGLLGRGAFRVPLPHSEKSRAQRVRRRPAGRR